MLTIPNLKGNNMPNLTDKLLSANTIKIVGRESIDNDNEALKLLEFALLRALRHLHTSESTATIYCQPRDAHGFIEFALVVTYHTGNKMHIGCIQRKPGAECESHS